MANLIREQRLIDSSKRALLKYVYISDSSAQANATLVDVSTLANALNANGYIMSSNTHPKNLYRTTIKRIFGTAKLSGYIKLQWQSPQNTEIVTITTGSFDYDFQSMGDGAVILNPDASSNGDILFSNASAASGDVLTLFIDLRKDARDYDAGQTADPAAFNRGSSSGF